MAASVGLLGPRKALALPLAMPLDKALRQVCIAKGRAENQRSIATRLKAVKWVSIAGLLAAAGLWSHLPPYDLVIRLVLASWAMSGMFQAFKSQRYAVAVMFGGLALVYNPVAPEFSLWVG